MISKIIKKIKYIFYINIKDFLYNFAKFIITLNF